MILDAQNLFSDAQTLTTGSENGIASTNVIDFGAIRNIGVGENLFLVVLLDTSMTDTGSNSALGVTLETDAYEAMNSVVATQTIGSFPATSAAGSRLVARIQPDALNERYGQLKYLSTNGALSACAVTAFITNNIQAYTSYDDSITIN